MKAECYAFRGTPADVAGKLYALPQDVVARAFYALFLESDEMAGIHVFSREQPGDGEGSVSVWSGSTLGELPERILTLARGAEGPALREKIVDLLNAHGNFADLGTVPCPPTPRGAFGHPLRPFSENPTVRVFVAAL